MNAIYYLYYPAWPDKNELALDAVYPELSEDDGGTLGAFLFTEVDGMIYTDIKTCLENVLNHASEYESYTGNMYHLQMNAETTTIFDLFSYEDDDEDDEDFDDDELDDEDLDDDEGRELKAVLKIDTPLLLQAMVEYHQKKDDFAKGWRPAIVVEGDPDDITMETVLAKQA